MRTYRFTWIGLAMLGCINSLAQPFLTISSKPVRSDMYFQKLTYHGGQQRYLTVSTYFNDSTLYRMDNYRLMNQLLRQEPQLDTLYVCERQGPTKIMYPDGQPYLLCTYVQGVLDGSLMVYYGDGSTKRRELYKEGYLKESQCYTSQGESCACLPLFQPPQWNGNLKDLKRYLTKQLAPLMEQEQILDLYFILTINEVGQIIKTDVKSNTNTIDSKIEAAAKAVMQSLPQETPNQFNWKPALMDGVAIADKQTIHIARRKGFLTVTVY